MTILRRLHAAPAGFLPAGRGLPIDMCNEIRKAAAALKLAGAIKALV